jgi:hypothetical protein
MTKYEVLKMLEDILQEVSDLRHSSFYPEDIGVMTTLIDVVQNEKLLEGERGHWPLSQ